MNMSLTFLLIWLSFMCSVISLPYQWSPMFHVDSIRIYVIGQMWPVNSTIQYLSHNYSDVSLMTKRGMISTIQSPNPLRFMTDICHTAERHISTRKTQSNSASRTTELHKHETLFLNETFLMYGNDPGEKEEKIISAMNTLFLASAFDGVVSTKTSDYIVDTTTSLGIPVVLWMADRLGEQQWRETPLTLHMEPSNGHLAEAMFDFVQTYNWHSVMVLSSLSLPGHQDFVQALKNIATSRADSLHAKHFKLEIDDVIYYEGLSDAKVYMAAINNPKYTSSYESHLRKIWHSEARVILFYGSNNEISLFHHVSIHGNVSAVFGREYVWILCPQAIKISRKDLSSSNPFMDSDLFSVDMNFFHKIGVPGMFALFYPPFQPEFTQAYILARDIWAKAMETLADHVALKIRANQSLGDASQRNSNSFIRQIPVGHYLMPDIKCYRDIGNGQTIWGNGKRLFDLMKSTTIYRDGEYIGYTSDGYINKTELLVLNTRFSRQSNSNQWVKVGKWERNSKFGRHKTRIRIEGVTWPGHSNKPPIGRPHKYKLRVATLQEPPFVIYGKVQEGGRCESSSLPCRIWNRHENGKVSYSSDDKTYANETSKNSSFHSNFSMACCAGLTIDILQELMKDLNFEVKLFEVPDGKWGGWSAESGWSGLVGALVDDKADLVVTSMKITPNRSKKIDFTNPFMHTGIGIMVTLREGAISPTAFLEPYDYPSWCLILLFSVHCSGAAIFLFEWLSPHRREADASMSTNKTFSLFSSLWLIWSMLFSAAVHADTPRGMASRFLSSIWALFALVFCASYTANLAAFMIAKKEYYDLKGLKDWRLNYPWNHKPPFRFATVPYGATEENIRLNYPNMNSYMRSFNKTSVEDGIRALKSREIDAFIYDATVLEYRVMQDDHCELRTVGNIYAMTGYGFGLPKNSKWYKRIDDQLLEYVRSGKLQKWQKFWFTGACKATGDVGNTNKTLGVKNFISAFLLLLGGIVVCVALLTLEHFFYRYGRHKLTKWDKYHCCGLISVSMGQLLSFEQSVNTTVNLMKYHKCANPICERQLWLIQMQLLKAQARIRQLEAVVYHHEKNRTTDRANDLQMWSYESVKSSPYIPINQRQKLIHSNGATKAREVSKVLPMSNENSLFNLYTPQSDHQQHQEILNRCQFYEPTNNRLQDESLESLSLLHPGVSSTSALLYVPPSSSLVDNEHEFVLWQNHHLHQLPRSVDVPNFFNNVPSASTHSTPNASKLLLDKYSIQNPFTDERLNPSMSPFPLQFGPEPHYRGWNKDARRRKTDDQISYESYVKESVL